MFALFRIYVCFTEQSLLSSLKYRLSLHNTPPPQMGSKVRETSEFTALQCCSVSSQTFAKMVGQQSLV